MSGSCPCGGSQLFCPWWCMFMSAAIISPKSCQEPGGVYSGKSNSPHPILLCRNLSMFCPSFVCDNCECFVSILLVYPYLSAIALCSGHSAHRQLQCCSRKANLSCLPVNIIVTDTPAIPSHRMNDPSVALKNGHPTSTLSQLFGIDTPPKSLAF